MKDYKIYKPYTKKEQLRAINQFKNKKKNLEKECHKLWREIVFLRAGHICEYYGCNREATQPHHVKTKGHCRHLSFDPDNGMALCYPHHKGSNEAAHSDINFKDKILGRYPGFKPIRTEQWFEILERKAAVPQKIDLELELLYLQNELKALQRKLGKTG